MSTCKRMWTDREIRSMAVHSVENKEDLKVFEHIVDKDGHKRFIEGDITINTITGVTQSYGKWSLSGSHFMIVIAGAVANATVLTAGTLVDIELPSWILSKIVGVVADIVDSKEFTLWATNYSKQSIGINLIKQTAKLRVSYGSLTLTADRTFRIQFDLLIDNE